jgi:phenylacetic acid degradation operon negative regulatory protein
VTTVKATPSRAGTDSGLRAFIVTIYGLYAREVGGWLGISTLIQLMAQLDVDEPAVRSSISRLKRRGILEAERVDGRAGYALSSHARVILDEGDRRIFRRRQGTVDEGWVLVVFSVPEAERQRRHTLRSRLSWLGFGSVGAGVWIAPAHLQDEARDVLQREELADYVDLFESRYLGFAAVTEEVAHWWDLAGLDRLYQQFHDEYAPVLDRWGSRRRTDSDGEAFADYVRVLTSWRRLPFLDPGLAPELLPRDWSGKLAADLFFALKGRLEQSAHRFVDCAR